METETEKKGLTEADFRSLAMEFELDVARWELTPWKGDPNMPFFLRGKAAGVKGVDPNPPNPPNPPYRVPYLRGHKIGAEYREKHRVRYNIDDLALAYVRSGGDDWPEETWAYWLEQNAPELTDDEVDEFSDAVDALRDEFASLSLNAQRCRSLAQSMIDQSNFGGAIAVYGTPWQVVFCIWNEDDELIPAAMLGERGESMLAILRLASDIPERYHNYVMRVKRGKWGLYDHNRGSHTNWDKAEQIRKNPGVHAGVWR